MDLSTAILIAIGIAVLACLIWIAVRLRSNQADQSFQGAVDLLKAELISQQAESLLTLRQSIDTANQIVNERLAEGTSSLDRRMAVLAEIQKQLGELREQTDHIEAVGKNIQSLSDLLRPPKLRGAVGELFLENILGQILPSAAFEMQYRFSSGQRVDAIVKLSDRLLPIDAKFPLEDFERLQKEPDDPTLQKRFSQSFRKHIDAIADKYIRPDEKTTDFAVMYVPAEAVYYQLISQSHQNGFEYALSRRVIPSSPGHLYAFLASVATLQAELALAGGEAGENSRRVRAGLDQLFEMTEKLAKFHTRMESSLRALTGGFNHARAELDSIRLQLEKLRSPEAATDEDTPPVDASPQS
ncbi:MAG: DNA recombination protein RmuC [candidate division Zixibacteria bacterium]|nr:DNA recombination protein RmuC [candidate division Zixibacteria bacterium]